MCQHLLNIKFKLYENDGKHDNFFSNFSLLQNMIEINGRSIGFRLELIFILDIIIDSNTLTMSKIKRDKIFSIFFFLRP